MLVAIVAGSAAGLLANAFGAGAPWLEWILANLAQPAGRIFLRLLFMLVIPLVVSALILGVAELGDVRRLGRIGLKTLAYTVVVSAIAVLIGVGLVNLVRPGEGLPPQLRATLTAQAARAPAPAAAQALRRRLHRHPRSPTTPCAPPPRDMMLPLMVFALFFGAGLGVLRATDRRAPPHARGALRGGHQAHRLVLRVAPIGVAALLFTLTARLGVRHPAPPRHLRGGGAGRRSPSTSSSSTRSRCRCSAA